ncbi:hypothetical protein, unlikely [Trypanosoma brucei gambiense DAL972]|uniref:Uncharacterized protein n=1 Tax=Trypanosoma brucei gambiense (strain MHOM/CI/86/DAL972) TaxID=679716 RepID=C9ZTA6_TRYB9|nr:hypothetical protein, unlikely [Trypanosoma brucei gambiense DAL972]CBH12641.1 hypothetical protein, unlikely [Trypanosoma brucei gambiense DAL972]|eukprot:XP_011774921.1 hypothetical protein, unlikely [Trypanosoma brucei gambiense DAL972]
MYLCRAYPSPSSYHVLLWTVCVTADSVPYVINLFEFTDVFPCFHCLFFSFFRKFKVELETCRGLAFPLEKERMCSASGLGVCVVAKSRVIHAQILLCRYFSSWKMG